ncbi:ABC-type transporter, periplasmic subunit [Caldalkalibacillus thermarum TA2.A1]|uniref:ABC-type transporter, periplasmic subunit n=1 Tax=Caldalkalibacillus thermarum (strain TA2.A1) TaxID=986075 RepID=F5L4P7_CALTT|nr:glutathione ABC transporter substrate-binding protein [Caldalkalibacillus thermarum]EGL83680.1 ABC-type transporter, periplasmic subunit [Caldalkalibacillus thermarum TA2.A1]
MRKVLVTVWVLLLSVALVACGSQETGNVEQAGGESASEQKQEGGTLVIAVLSDATHLDPHLGADIPSANVYHGKIFETLVVQDEHMEIQPGLATEWERIDDLTWEFKLREGVQFHDGTEFTAEAVKANIERILDEELGSPRANLFEMITEVEVVDDYTVRLVTAYPFTPLLANLAHYSGGIISPQAIEAEKNGGTPISQHPVGTGPLKFEAWEPGQEIVLSKFEHHWGEGVKVDEVVFKVVPEDATRVSMVETGEAHIAEPVEASNIDRIEASPNMKLYRSEGLGIDYIGFNLNKKPFDDVRVRQAINWAVDTEAIIDHVYNGVGMKAEGPMGPRVWGYHPDLKGYGYDPEKAKQLLAEAGYADGFQTTIWTNDNPERMNVAEVVQSQLKEVGIEADIEVMEWGAYLEHTAAGKHDMFILGWSNMTGDADYNQYYLFHSAAHGSAGNRTFYTNERVDELIELGRQETDPEQRLAYYHEAQEIEVEEAPMIFLRHTEYIAALGKDVEGFWLHPSRIMMLNDVTIP